MGEVEQGCLVLADLLGVVAAPDARRRRLEKLEGAAQAGPVDSI
jgi:hypothetical protein